MSRSGLTSPKVSSLRLGFCSPGNPADSHGRCPGSLRGRACVCQCHVVVEESAGFAPGFYDDVPEPDYHSGAFGPTEGSLSQSGIKTLLKAPSLFRYEREHPPVKDFYDFGAAVHKRVLGKGDEIRVLDFDSYRTDKAKAEAAEARAAGAVPILKHKHQIVLDMAQAVADHPKAAKLLTKGRAEVSAYAVDQETGVWRRGRFDYLRDDLAVDYKSTASAHPRAFAKSLFDFGYFIQAPYYLDLAADLGMSLGDFVFIAQEKDPPYLVGVYRLDDDDMDLGRRRIRTALQRFRDCRETDVWPGYAVPENHTLSLPNYAYSEDNQ